MFSAIQLSAICIPIIGPSIEEAKEQIARATEADLFELRLDKISWRSADELEGLIRRKPTIFTLKGEIDPAVLALRPEYVDVEVEQLHRFRSHIPPGVKIIASYHDHEKTPADLDGLLAKIREVKADYYKIATHAHSSADTLRMLLLCRSHPDLIGVCMGGAGIATRVLGCAFGSPWTYAALDEQHVSAPGQLPAGLLQSRYHFRSLTEQTQILGVIGDPVDKSPGVAIHNRVYEQLGIDAVYLPFPLSREALPEFLSLAAEVGIRGMSVTMPLKEAVCPLLASGGEIGAVNTLVLQEGSYRGANFDGIGACNAVGELSGQRVVILGAGGAARAIAVEAKKRGGEIRILNRTAERAKQLAEEVGGTWGELGDPIDADVVIQSTSVGMEPGVDRVIIDPSRLPERARVLDVVIRPPDTAFLKGARERGCQIIAGGEMWKQQAAHQLKTWFGIPVERSHELL